jgi:circadian clock protein KaiB
MQEMERQEADNGVMINKNNKLLLVLYITGSAPRSISAINNITSICKNNLIDYELKIIDIYENPNLARKDQIVAIPTLVRVLPSPKKRIIGDLTNTEKVLTFLQVS